jgi:antitoxin ParD1/3/4
MSGRNFSLTERLSDFVDDQVASGRHQNASEVVREALRRYEADVLAECANLKVLERVAVQGLAEIARGEYTLIQGPADERRLLERLKNRSTARKRAAKRP